MTSRERVRMTLEHREPDRVPIHDSLWVATVSRWHKEGLPEEIPVSEYFDYEIVGFGADLSPRFPVKVLERNETYIVETTPYGGIRRNFRDYSTTPEIIDWPVKSKEDWYKIKDRLQPNITRVNWVSSLNDYSRTYGDGKFVTYSAAMGYDQFQSYIKTEELLILLVEDPEWAKDMFRTHAILLIEMAKIMMEYGFKFDGAFLYNDMGYRNGLLFSPRTYQEVLQETDAMVCEFFHKNNMPVILHSCGNVKELIPYLIDAGFDCLQPLEVKAGMDLLELKPEYGDKISFMGGIDVRKMTDPVAIEEEISRKFEVAKKGGGYIYHSDHSIPKNISFEDYNRVISLVKKYGKY
ncbi:MAG TPA: uroporphyrinogen decarboxylase family protein [bacterium]|nr:uroporphyrinogen decarboxylase family protein [bacterium]HOL54563.1 uroporphyrinogen decarboxylase family protein [bacterium]HPO81347.1 uroporphyrinogen decarboxylase family protein [bacterium]